MAASLRGREGSPGVEGANEGQKLKPKLAKNYTDYKVHHTEIFNIIGPEMKILKKHTFFRSPPPHQPPKHPSVRHPLPVHL